MNQWFPEKSVMKSNRMEKVKMEKITKEELLEKLGGTLLRDDELENISGGARNLCHNKCNQIEDTAAKNTCLRSC